MRLVSPLFLLVLALAMSVAGCTRGNDGVARGTAVDAASLAATRGDHARVEDAAVVIDASDASSPMRDASALNAEGWCTDGLEALDAETCIVVPDEVRAPRTLLIYLHGTVPPTGQMQVTVQQIVLANAKKRGYVAMMPRGRRGIGPNKLPDWWAWPTTAEAHRKYAKGMVDTWLAKKGALEARLGAPFAKTFLGGSSNGAYFLTVLALKGEIAVDGFGAFSGGSRSGFTADRVTTAARPPFYVGYGTFDDTKPMPIALGELLHEAKWPSEVRAHRVSHGAQGVYLDEAMEFWGGP